MKKVFGVLLMFEEMMSFLFCWKYLNDGIKICLGIYDWVGSNESF